MSRPLRVLIVEDSSDDLELLLRELRNGGYEPCYRQVAAPDAFLGALESQEWELVLCDYSMSGFSGTQALSFLRSRGLDVPFIYVSGTIGEETAVAAMRAGAQDYVIKDNLRRLVPAIERELREAEARRDRARVEAEHRSLETRFREVLAMAPDAIVAVDQDQRITVFNRAAEALFGYQAGEVTGQFLDLLLPSRLVAAHRDHLAAFIRGPGRTRAMNERGEVFGRRKDGVEFPATASISRIAEDGGATAIVIISDITERKRLESQLRQAQKMEAVGQLTGGLAHDFNNLLTATIGNLDLLREVLEDRPEALELAQLAIESSLRGAQVTRQLLAFSRRQSLETRVVDVNRLAGETIGLLRSTLGGQIEIDLKLAEDLHPALADPAQVDSALVNLAINARDAMPTGGRLTIETASKRLDQGYADSNHEVTPGDYVMLAVSDSGSGIAPGILDKVFEPFFTTKAHDKGTGLGLSMVYGFAKQSGGHVKIYSEVGQGTTVRLYLPQAAPDATLSPEPALEEASDRAPDALVLLVEDDAAVRSVAAAMLRSLGYRVREAEDGRSALALLAEPIEIDLLLTDVVMPGGLSGPELAREARRRRPGLKVLFTSGYAEAALGHRPDAGEMASVLSKPYRKTDLDRKLRQALAHA